MYEVINDMKKCVWFLFIEFSIVFEYIDENIIFVRKKENIMVYFWLLIYVIGLGNFFIIVNNM